MKFYALVKVEMDKTLIVRCKCKQHCLLNQVWLFEKIERNTKKKFVVPLTGDVNERKDMLYDVVEKLSTCNACYCLNCFQGPRKLRKTISKPVSLNIIGATWNHSVDFKYYRNHMETL